MSNSFREVSSKSWLERIKESIKGVLVGIILFVAAFPLLWWNEGRAVQTAKSLTEGLSIVVPIGPEKVDPANEQKLVHVTGEATTEETLLDPQFGISAGAVKLLRKVQMYQWEETKTEKTEKKAGGGEETVTEYSYDKVWSEEPIDSGEFAHPEGHENPGAMPLRSASFVAGKVTMGGFTLSPSQIGRIDNETPRPVDTGAYEMLPPEVRKEALVHEGGYYLSAAAAEMLSQLGPLPREEQPEEGQSAAAGAEENAAGRDAPAGPSAPPTPPTPPEPAAESPAGSAAVDPAHPQLGDTRISFAVVLPGTVSLIAQQVGATFQPYQTQAGDALDILALGSQSAEAMFAEEQAKNVRLTWILRLVGFLLMLFGLMLVARPMVVLADVWPLMGNLVGMGLFVFAALVAAALSLLTVAVAWLFYRPLLGVVLIGAAVVVVAGLVAWWRKGRAPAGPPPIPPAART